jgi:hypothetical protein
LVASLRADVGPHGRQRLGELLDDPVRVVLGGERAVGAADRDVDVEELAQAHGAHGHEVTLPAERC